MRIMKKRFVPALFAALLLGIGAVGGQAWATHRFSDVPDGGWIAQQVDWLVDNNIATGYTDGTFEPSAPITRAQVGNWLRNYDAQAAMTPTVAGLTIRNESNSQVAFGWGDPQCRPEDTAAGTYGTAPCASVFPVGTVVTIRTQGSTVAWGDDAAACGSASLCTLTMDADKAVHITDP